MNFTQAHGDHLDPDRHDLPKRKAGSWNKWVHFTKCTEDPKLAWLERQLAARGIPSRRHGQSRNAPILEVRQRDFDAAWEVLTPVDDVRDDHPRFSP